MDESSSSGADMSDVGSLGELSSACDSSSSEDDLGAVCTSSEGYISDTDALLQPPTTLLWVRVNALRVHDNPALSWAIQEPYTRFRAVFIIDPWFASGEKKFGACRWRFLIESLHDLDNQLKCFNSRLYVARGQPVAVLEKLCVQWNVTSLVFQTIGEPHSQMVETALERLAKEKGLEVHKFPPHMLYGVDRVLEMNQNQPVTTFNKFKELLPFLGLPEAPLHPPRLPVTKLITCEDELLGSDYRVPTMEELGFLGETLYTNHWIGGESEALRKLPIYYQLRSQPPSNPVDQLFDKSSLSPYIRFGCLSVRYFLWNVKCYAKSNPKLECLVKEVVSKLLQREFFLIVAAQVPNFDCKHHNPICFQLPWGEDSNLVQVWKEGRTGFPWIDAAMRQLRKEGWIHRCLRESVATFLTRGDLWISWVQGKDTFEELLLDFETSICCGCWMRSSCSAFFTGPIEHYCPIRFGQKMDPNGRFVRTYIPELQNFPSEYIYCPWLAPLSVQQESGCMVGEDYPNPVVDHLAAGALCCKRLQTAMSMIQQHAATQFMQPDFSAQYSTTIHLVKPA